MYSEIYNNLFTNGLFGILLTIAAFKIGLVINKKTKLVICNPLLIAIIFVIVFLVITGIKYEDYYIGGEMFQFMLTPATVAFAIPLYRQMSILRKNLWAILISVFCGCLSCTMTIFILSKIWNISDVVFYGLMPKSVTLAIALGITEELGGLSGVTCVGVVVSGIIGAAFVTVFSKIFKIDNKIALGLSVGTATHAIGTSRAIQLDELVGAMGSLSIVIAGVMTVVIVPIVSSFY